MAPVASAVTRVLITGFGPFQGVPNNPSWGIASRLPSSLPNNIELIVYPSPVPVAFHPVVDLVPKLVAEHQPDLSLHMGVNEGIKWFAIEQSSQRGYFHWSTDVDGKSFSLEEEEKLWGDQPQRLQTDINLSSVLNEWQQRTSDVKWPPELSNFQDADGNSLSNSAVEVKLFDDVMSTQDVRWTDSVGTYLCGFIYYAGMAEMGKKGKNQKRDVAFMHVPSLETDELLDVGVEVTIELVQSLVQTWRSQRAA